MSSGADDVSSTRQSVVAARARDFASAMNRLDAEAAIGLLAEGIRYESQSVFEPLRGVQQVGDYLRRKFETLRTSDTEVRLELGEVDAPMEGRRPCAIGHQDGEAVALFLLGVDSEGLIDSIFIATAVPHPMSAQGSGEFPGLRDATPVSRVLTARRNLLPRTTPITFHCFRPPEIHGETVRRLIRSLRGYYPNTSFEEHVHAFEETPPGSEGWAHLEHQIQRFNLLSYPAMAVEAAGNVLIDGANRAPFTKLRALLSSFFEPPPYALPALAMAGGECFDDGTPAYIDHFDGEYSFLSNFHLSPVTYEGLEYPAVEHAFQAAKTLDHEARRPFTQGSPDRAKHLGRRVQLRADWDDIRVEVMRTLLELKFQNAELGRRLLATGEASLIEANWWGDQFWGISQDVGENWLGRLLMELRDDLRGGGG